MFHTMDANIASCWATDSDVKKHGMIWMMGHQDVTNTLNAIEL